MVPITLTRKLKKHGNSIGFNIPNDFVRDGLLDPNGIYEIRLVKVGASDSQAAIEEPSGKVSTADALKSGFSLPKKEVSPSKGKEMGPAGIEPSLVTVVIGHQERASVCMDWDTVYASQDTVLELELGSGLRATSGVFSSFSEVEA